MESGVQLVESNVGSSELDADQFNFGSSLPEEQAIVDTSPHVKGNSNKKRTRNFSEKEDLLLVSAWLEVSMDPVQNIDQSRGTYWQRIHEHYHKHKTFESDRNVSSLSHRWGIINGSVSKFCASYSQIIRSKQSGTREPDWVQQACALYKENDQEKRSFGLLDCWNVLQHAQKWIDLPSNNNTKKQKISSNASPRSYTPGTNESHHVDEEDGPSHTSPSKGGRPIGQKKEKERRAKNPNSHGETLYMEAMEYSWSKREKADELREIKKKERNDERVAVETRRMEIKQETENKRLEL